MAIKVRAAFGTGKRYFCDLNGDTVIGNDVWIGQNVTVLPSLTDRSFTISIIKVCFPIFCPITKNVKNNYFANKILQNKTIELPLH